MKINTGSFGLAVALVAGVLWSFYCLGDLALDVLVIAFVDGADGANLSNFNWAEHLKSYLAQIMFITIATGSLGWLVAEIYNDLEDAFSLKLK